MNETINTESLETSMEATSTDESAPSADNDDWDDIDLSDVRDDAQEPEAPPEETPEEPEADQPKEEADGQEAEQPESQEEQEAADQQLFELKHLGTVHQVNRDQVVALAQKGMDYDHIRGERDSARERFSELEGFLMELAAPQGISIEELMDQTRASVLADREGIEQSVALQRVKLERDRRSFEAQQRQAAQAQAVRAQEDQRIQQSFLRFAGEYAEVDPQEIPKEVWDEFGKGHDLTDAYARWENKQLKRQLQEAQERQAAQEQNEKNKERSTGSQQSAGAGDTQKRDPIDEDWYSGD